MASVGRRMEQTWGAWPVGASRKEEGGEKEGSERGAQVRHAAPRPRTGSARNGRLYQDDQERASRPVEASTEEGSRGIGGGGPREPSSSSRSEDCEAPDPGDQLGHMAPRGRKDTHMCFQKLQGVGDAVGLHAVHHKVALEGRPHHVQLRGEVFVKVLFEAGLHKVPQPHHGRVVAPAKAGAA